MDQSLFQEELVRLGGYNLQGEPILRAVRGDQVTRFACGRVIPKYFVPGGARREEITKFRLRNVYTQAVTDCTRDEARECWERSMRYDLTNYHLAETCRIVTITPQGRDGYFIEQWLPPEKVKDTPESWESNRYAMWFDEEVGAEVKTDMIGPFPSEGIYDLFMESDTLNRELLQRVYRAWRRRDEWKQTKSDELMVADAFREAEAREEQSVELVADMLKSEMAPHAFRGLYLSNGDPAKMNKRTKHGRAT